MCVKTRYLTRPYKNVHQKESKFLRRSKTLRKSDPGIGIWVNFSWEGGGGKGEEGKKARKTE